VEAPTRTSAPAPAREAGARLVRRRYLARRITALPDSTTLAAALARWQRRASAAGNAEVGAAAHHQRRLPRAPQGCWALRGRPAHPPRRLPPPAPGRAARAAQGCSMNVLQNSRRVCPHAVGERTTCGLRPHHDRLLQHARCRPAGGARRGGPRQPAADAQESLHAAARPSDCTDAYATRCAQQRSAAPRSRPCPGAARQPAAAGLCSTSRWATPLSAWTAACALMAAARPSSTDARSWAHAAELCGRARRSGTALREHLRTGGYVTSVSYEGQAIC